MWLLKIIPENSRSNKSFIKAKVPTLSHLKSSKVFLDSVDRRLNSLKTWPNALSSSSTCLVLSDWRLGRLLRKKCWCHLQLPLSWMTVTMKTLTKELGGHPKPLLSNTSTLPPTDRAANPRKGRPLTDLTCPDPASGLAMSKSTTLHSSQDGWAPERWGGNAASRSELPRGAGEDCLAGGGRAEPVCTPGD